MDAREIIENGVLLKKRPLRQRCAKCDNFLVLCIYRYNGRNDRKIIRCETCGTASWINKEDTIQMPQKPMRVSELLQKKKEAAEGK